MKQFPLLLVLVVFGSAFSCLAAGRGAGIPKVKPEDRICMALYTTCNDVLKMTVQFYPLQEGESRTVFLKINKGAAWKTVAETRITREDYGNKRKDKTWTAHFRVNGWDMTRDWRYQVRALNGVAVYEGLVRRDPVEKNEIVVAVFTGNSIYEGHGGDIPRTDLVENIKKMNPDLLFFSGDQVYDHKRHLGYWLRFGRDFGEIIRNTPTITIPDDHDVGQANLWGASGKVAKTGAGPDGGYFMPAAYVKAVERAQTWHLPDPYDPTPVQQGIGVYYTALTLGRISFAILEDRKFKTGPEGLVPQRGPRPDHILDPDYDPKSVDVADAVLLGERQLTFLNEWAKNWQGADMKAVLSQTIFCGGAHVHGKIGGRLHADMDSNGWPQTGRNKALAAMRRCFAVHIAGDQHLATIFHHGIAEWEDAGFSFCVPSIANLYLRWWDPLVPGGNRQPGMPEYTGRHFDGFGNRVTCWAAANPSQEINGGAKLTARAAGFGVVRFNKESREIIFECWPRNVDIQDPGTQQYPGWPKTIQQADNYGRKAVAYLPPLHIKGGENPVIQVIHETDQEVVYTLRIKGSSYCPKVFEAGTYTVQVGEAENKKIFSGIKSTGLNQNKSIEVILE
ncbi:MAG: alkaline phosphatase D family protein [Candidatus Hydrogenedentes bacterium]|nr:alkaline phosphatase D family protein [Candidatus Hydrogenedentota bacterium]